MIWILIVCAVMAVVVVLVVKSSKRHKDNARTPEPEPVEAPPAPKAPANQIEYDPSRTIDIFDDCPSVPTLFLTDITTKEKYSTPLKDQMSAGRKIGPNSLVIPDNTVSGRHCEFYMVSEKLYIRDLGSSNGTFIIRDGEMTALEANKGYALLDGDVVRLGRVDLRPSIK